MVCCICGCLSSEFRPYSSNILQHLQEQLSSNRLLPHIPSDQFFYSDSGNLNGLVLAHQGVLKITDTSSEYIGYIADVVLCTSCHALTTENKLPLCALVASNWTAGIRPATLDGLTWAEELIIARIHVSVYVQKCRVKDSSWLRNMKLVRAVILLGILTQRYH